MSLKPGEELRDQEQHQEAEAPELGLSSLEPGPNEKTKVSPSPGSAPDLPAAEGAAFSVPQTPAPIHVESSEFSEPDLGEGADNTPSLQGSQDEDPSFSWGGVSSSGGSSLDIQPPSDDSIFSRIKKFEDASEANLPLEPKEPVVHQVTGIGSILDKKYRIVHKIAGGGMGVVYAAVHAKLNKRVAIKILSPGTLDNEEYHRRFIREAKASTMLSSPHTVRVYDYNVSLWGEPYLVMEFVKGGNLRQVVKKEGPLELLRAINITKQIAISLTEAHSHGLTHRDLKPSNVMIMKMQGHEDFAKIFDFGVAKLSSSEDADLTRQGTVLGTPRYMAPEQITAPQLVNTQADIYSLGLIFYHMVTGKKPFHDLSADAVMFQRSKGKKNTLPKELGIPPQLQELYRLMTSEAPENRPSAEEVVSALSAIEGQIKYGNFTEKSLLDSHSGSNKAYLAGGIAFLLTFALAWKFWPSKEPKPLVRPPSTTRSQAPKERRGVVPPTKREVAPKAPVPEKKSPAPKKKSPPLSPKARPRRPKPRKSRRAIRRRPQKRRSYARRSRRIQIGSNPSGARVFLKGRLLGRTPLRFQLPWGQSAVLRIQKSGYFSKKIAISARSRRRSFSARLKEVRIELP